MMNPMAMMSQYQGMMGNMPNPEMMSMMNSYCGPTGNSGPGSFGAFPDGSGMGGGPQGMSMNPQAMAQMMRKRPMDGGFDGADSTQASPAAKRANFGSDMPALNSGDSGANAGGGDDDAAAPQDNDKSGGSTSPNASSAPKQHVTVMPSKEGIKFYSRNDVLCGRGGGTNVHPGNRRFRDLINANRRAYLKARKNDKPAISRSIVRTIREMNGRFLKKDEKLGLWFEIGDDGAREKTSQALRQRAPEMRKILFEDEQRQQQQQQQEMLMQRQQMMAAGGMGGMGMGGMGGMGMNTGMGGMGMGGMGMGNMGSGPIGMGNMGGGGGGGGGGGNQQGGGDQDGSDGDMSNSLLAKYNMLHQKNWLAQEKNLILQRLAMSGLNPNSLNNTQNNIDSMTQQTLMSQGMKPVTPRGA
jgi:hypothetical protein